MTPSKPTSPSPTASGQFATPSSTTAVPASAAALSTERRSQTDGARRSSPASRIFAFDASPCEAPGALP
jgi:hypothetical protein